MKNDLIWVGGVALSLILGAGGCSEESTEQSSAMGDCRQRIAMCAEGFQCVEENEEWICVPSAPASDGAVVRRDRELSDQQSSLRRDGGAPIPDRAAEADEGRDGVIPGDAAVPGNDQGESPRAQRISVAGRQLLIDGRPLHLKGVNWNPVGRGGLHPQDLDFEGFVELDAELMAAAGINVVRTYESITSRRVLDILWARGIYVMNTVYIWGGAPVESLREKVNATKDHPAILMWVIGNEWNYNGLYVGLSHEESVQRVREATRLIKELDAEHPVATVYGGVPNEALLAQLPEVDAWGLNIYRGLGFGDLFQRWRERSERPMFLGEFGADAYNATLGREDQAAQAEATTALTQELVRESAVNGGVCLGGLIFEFADEWWKDGAGRPDVHDVGGAAPGGGPHPDQVFNEEWWGLVEVDRTPRAAYRAYQEISIPSP